MTSFFEVASIEWNHFPPPEYTISKIKNKVIPYEKLIITDTNLE